MKTSSNSIMLSGLPAYLIYWQKFYECKVSLSTVMVLDTNLEIIVDDAGKLLAYRHDCPLELAGMLNGVGEWHVFGLRHPSET